MQLDIIGDVHGHADALESLLGKLGYQDRNGAWRHAAGRRAVFVGDLVDRGPRQLDVIAIVRGMVEAGTALAVMGNHEFNAIAYATPDPREAGAHFRRRMGHHVGTHAVFLDAMGGADTALHRDIVGFCRELPLWLDLEGARIVHACWSQQAVDALDGAVDAEHRLTAAGLTPALTKGTVANDACEILLKGPEIPLPRGVWYRDAQGTERHRTRIRWWDATATTIRAACVETDLAGQLPDDPLPPDCVVPLDETKPVFFGHYWLRGALYLLAPRRACLDFSIARHGVLCAYRFDGERDLAASKLVWVAAAAAEIMGSA